MAKEQAKVQQAAHGHDWRRKKNEKQTRQSHTPGKTKGLNCQAGVSDRYFAKRSRAYKAPGFDTWCQESKRKNKGG